MSKRTTLPASPLSGWTDEESMLHAVITVAVQCSRESDKQKKRTEFKTTAKTALARLNASLAARGARCGYTL